MRVGCDNLPSMIIRESVRLKGTRTAQQLAFCDTASVPKKNFQLSVERVFQAEEALIEQMKKAYL